MENESKTLKDEVSSNLLMPPKRRRLSKSNPPEYLKLDEVNPSNEVFLPVKQMKWKPFMACKVVPSTRIKYISDDESESEVTKPTIIKKDDETVPKKDSKQKLKKKLF